MPIITRVPVFGNAYVDDIVGYDPVVSPVVEGEVVSPIEIDYLFQIYGMPEVTGFSQVNRYIKDEAGELVAEQTFEATDPSEQDTLDAWVLLLDADSPAEMDIKIQDLIVADQTKAVEERRFPAVSRTLGAPRPI